MNEAFASWLTSGDTGLCDCREGRTTYLFIRVAKSPDFDYLFCQQNFNEALTRDRRFEYAGIYCKRDGLLYDEQYSLKAITQGSDDWSKAALRSRLKADVCKRVEDAIGNDRANLTVTEITTPRLMDTKDNYLKYYAANQARQHFLDTVDFEPPIFRCSYEPAQWTEDSLLLYIVDPDGYAALEAAAYIAANQEQMLLDFIENEALASAYQEILDHPDWPVHRVKRIMAAMNGTSAKTVNVTIRKDGVEFSFKSEATQFRRDCTSSYNSWDIAAQDRRKFEQLFGRHADFYPHEIVRITYARSVLYEADV